MNSPEAGWKFSCPIAFYVSQDFTPCHVPAMSAMVRVDNNTMNEKERDDDRFSVLQLLFTWAASPLFPVETSWLYNIYCFLLVVCTYLTQVMIFMGVLKNLDDIPYIMEAARPLITMLSFIWIHFFIRYPAS
jgi:hypothetical protein